MTPFLIVAALALASPGANARGSHADAPADAPDQTETAQFHVEGMACDRCSSRLRESLLKIDGVLSVTAEHEKKLVLVRFDPRRVAVERLKQEIQRNGFDVSP